MTALSPAREEASCIGNHAAALLGSSVSLATEWPGVSPGDGAAEIGETHAPIC